VSRWEQRGRARADGGRKHRLISEEDTHDDIHFTNICEPFLPKIMTTDKLTQRSDERFVFANPKRAGKYLLFNVSRTGAFVGTSEAIEKGNRITIDITMPANLGILTVTGAARWVQRAELGDTVLYLAGLKFEKHDEPSGKIIHAYMEFLWRRKLIQESQASVLANLEKLKSLLMMSILQADEDWSGQIH